MPDPNKITILLADEDALRRDGLAAVLQGTAKFQIVSQCPDGEVALSQIRQLRPDVAVVDLNIPKIHGIELVRRIRSESLGTKVVILSGSTDDDIIREVVRAGGDAYLLKNGPARHLIDAISYVCDGGQYFSPQLRRDGLDRRLLEETPRDAPRRRATDEVRDDFREEEEDSAPESEPDNRSSRDSLRDGPRDGRYGRSARRPAARRPAEPRRLREQLREYAGSDNLEDRDYEILGMMADGIRPILDRLEEIEGRVSGMETGAEPVPSDPRGWLTTQMSDTFQGRAGSRDLALGRNVQELEARLPQLIEQAVTARFHSLAEKLQQEIEDTHVRTLETFVKNIQVKLVQRVSALETDMSKQAEAMNQLREYSQRTEDNLSRLISGVDKLANELPRRLQPPETPVEYQHQDQDPPPSPEQRIRKRRSSGGSSRKIVGIAAVAVVLLGGAGFAVSKRFSFSPSSPGGKVAAAGGGDAAAALPRIDLAANADSKTKMAAAQEYTDRKEYSTAEDIYKQVLKSEPNNADALKALASVLYREDKIDESAAILEKIK